MNHAWTALALLVATSAQAETAAELMARYQQEARLSDASFAASAQRGAQFFRQAGSKDWHCNTCHTDNPAAPGKHATTGKAIEPLAPAANPARFSKADKVEKWFKRNCNDVLERACTPAEKSDLLAYLQGVKP
ncbi:MAG: hypothetical protein RIR00_1747 [Pseudomonadota bacterium]|jgi:mono/diheme cytochrome c family protein